MTTKVETREEHIKRAAFYAIRQYEDAMRAYDRGEITERRRYELQQKANFAFGQVLSMDVGFELFRRTIPQERPETVVFVVRDIDTGRVKVGVSENHDVARDILVAMRGEFRMEVVALNYAGPAYARILVGPLKLDEDGWYTVGELELRLLQAEGIDEDLEDLWLQD